MPADATAEPGRALLADVLDVSIAEVPSDASIDGYPAWDSLAHMRLVARVEQILGRDLSTEEMLALDSLAALDAILPRNMA